jgi:hypothetical protein
MKRLIDDPEVVSELRAELQRYASEQAPLDLGRALGDLRESLQPGAAPQLSGWSSLSGATRLLIVAALGGGAALGVTTLRGGTPPSAAPYSAPSERTEIAVAPPAPAVVAAQPAAGTSPQQAPRRASKPAPTRSTSQEVAQLARIKAVLDSDPAAARRLIRTAQREFPAGVLVEERDGLDVIAQFALGQHERARAAAERFVARYPNSALRPKLEHLLEDAQEQQ